MGCSNQPNIVESEEALEIEEVVYEPLTTEEKIEDFEYLYMILEENYPFFGVNKRLHGVDWLNNKDDYLEKVEATTSDLKYRFAIKSILSDLNNGHVEIINQYYYLKILNEFGDLGLQAWVDEINVDVAANRYDVDLTQIQKDEEDDIDSPVEVETSVTSTVVTEIIEEEKIAYMKIPTFDFMQMEVDHDIIENFMMQVNDYPYVILDIRGNSGGSEAYWMEMIVPYLISEPVSYKTYYMYRGGEFELDFLNYKAAENGEEQEGGLIPFKNVSDVFEEEYINNLPTELDTDFNYYIGSVRVFEPNEKSNFNGKVFLLVDRAVYSSSEAFAVFAKETDFATLVGEVTGGDGIGTNPLVVTLPNSGLVIRFPITMGLTSEGFCNEEHKTVPDVITDSSDAKNVVLEMIEESE